MIIRSKSPLRISFAGGGTDVSPYCDENGGAVLCSTINKYAYCSLIPKNTDDIVVNSLDFDMTVKYNAAENLIYDGKLDLVKAALKQFSISKGCEVYIQCDAPAGSGLGTSSTVMISLLGAILKWQGIDADSYTIAHKAYKAEREDLSISGGFQDQFAATFGGFNFIEFYGKDNIVVNPLRIKKDIINELQYNLLLCYTGNIHISAHIIDDQIKNYNDKQSDVLKAMSDIKALAYSMKNELLKGNLDEFGRLLHYGWESKKKMSSRISSPKIDEMYYEAIKAGAIGGKLLGAGGGGYLLIYCPYNKKHIVARRLTEIGGQLTDWNFELRGVQSWKFDPVRWNNRNKI